MATAKREAWADVVDPWRQFFSSKIPFRFNKALFLFGPESTQSCSHPRKSPKKKKCQSVSGERSGRVESTNAT